MPVDLAHNIKNSTPFNFAKQSFKNILHDQSIYHLYHHFNFLCGQIHNSVLEQKLATPLKLTAVPPLHVLPATPNNFSQKMHAGVVYRK